MTISHNAKSSRSAHTLLVLSDMHLGAGHFLPSGEPNFKEDCFFDRELMDFLEYHRTGHFLRRSVEIVFNGDFFEMLETTDYSSSPLRLTETLALERIDQVLRGHPGVFAELSRFCRTANKRIRFLPGNHDRAIVFPRVQQLLGARIGGNVSFSNDHYVTRGVYITHGDQFTGSTSNGSGGPLVEEPDGTHIVNHDLTSLLSIEFVYRNKSDHTHAIYNMHPMMRVLQKYFREGPITTLVYGAGMVGYVLKRWIRPVSHRFTKRRFTWKDIRGLGEDWNLSLENAARNLLKDGVAEVVIFGHSHKARYRRFENGRVYVSIQAAG